MTHPESKISASPQLMSRLIETMAQSGAIAPDIIRNIATTEGLSESDVEGVISFYHFFSSEKTGTVSIYLNDSVVSCMKGYHEVKKAFEDALGITMGSVTDDGKFGLFRTSDIGLNDQEPSALVNNIPFPNLTPESATALISSLKEGSTVHEAAFKAGAQLLDGVPVLVKNELRKSGAVFGSDCEPGEALDAALACGPEGIIDEIKKSNLRGRGGAGFPTGMKLQYCRANEADQHYVVCNADEGEPGTFKDRYLLMEKAVRVMEGMAIAAVAVGATKGFIYLRSEYTFMKPYLEKVRDSLVEKGILGEALRGNSEHSFHLDIVSGAGAYVCGEESALINSAEGKRGEPRNRPPFPVQRGYLGKPTSVNNVETFATLPVIIKNGGDSFRAMGTFQSSGTKLLSVSGDCDKPGIYEVEFGITLKQLLHQAGGLDAQAVQVGGPSGLCVGRGDFEKSICYNQLSTGGSVIVIGPDRDILEVVENFMEFFTDESCGWCVPCRVGNRILLDTLRKIRKGNGTEEDIYNLKEWGQTIKAMSRCGLGQTSPNPVLSTLENFPLSYTSRLADSRKPFDLSASTAEFRDLSGRTDDPAEAHHG